MKSEITVFAKFQEMSNFPSCGNGNLFMHLKITLTVYIIKFAMVFIPTLMTSKSICVKNSDTSSPLRKRDSVLSGSLCKSVTKCDIYCTQIVNTPPVSVHLITDFIIIHSPECGEGIATPLNTFHCSIYLLETITSAQPK